MRQNTLSSAQRDLFTQLFTDEVPLLDVRAAAEFNRGAFPTAANLPILHDAERHDIGICYKNKGQVEATRLGHRLVSGKARRQRLAAWAAYIDKHPSALLYCFRGGQRSRIAVSWLKQADIHIEPIDGGYKALRSFLIEQFSDLPTLIVIAGKTGTGKTELLRQVSNRVDLEGRANHRGSAFGQRLTAQPTQINFENTIAIDFLKNKGGKVFLEDEGRMIGSLQLPAPLQDMMRKAPLYLLEDRLDNRVARIHADYIVEPQVALQAVGIDTVAFLSARYQAALLSIRRRLGGRRQVELGVIMAQAFKQQAKGDNSYHKEWIRGLLTDYYDPMYAYQLEKKQQRIVKSGGFEYLLQQMTLS